MKRLIRQIVLAASASVVIASLGACGSDGGGGGNAGSLTGVPYTGKTTQSEITQATVADGLSSVSSFIPVCSNNAVARVAAKKTVNP